MSKRFFFQNFAEQTIIFSENAVTAFIFKFDANENSFNRKRVSTKKSKRKVGNPSKIHQYVSIRGRGLPVLDRKFKVYWLSYLPGILGADYTVLMIYTICKFISEPLKALQSTCISGVVYPVIEILSYFHHDHCRTVQLHLICFE